MLADLTCGVSMLWAPNTAAGYPWRVNDLTNQCAAAAVPRHGRLPAGAERAACDSWLAPRHGAPPGTPDFAAMDTNRDGHLTAADDPFSPYYPGPQQVS